MDFNLAGDFVGKIIFMKNGILCLAFLVLLWRGQAADEKQPVAETATLLSINAVVSEVLNNNPALRAASARLEAMEARVPQERAWDDPRVGVDVERSRTGFATYNDTEWMASQTIPLTGKNILRGRAASAEAFAAYAELRQVELELTARARAAYFRFANAYAQLEVNRRNDLLLKQFSEVSRAKYEFGTRNQADIFIAESDLAKNLEARIDLERQLSDEQSRLNVLMNRPAQSPLGRPANEALQHFNFDLVKAQTLALENRPELLNARKKFEAAQSRQTLAKRSWIPDPEIRVEARQFNGTGKGLSEYDTGIFFSFPWFNRGKYKGAIREAEKNQESAEYEMTALQTETLGLVRDQLKKIETFHHHYELFRDKLVPLAQQSVQSHQIAYEGNKGGFLELIIAQRTVQDVETILPQHLADYQIALAELEMIVGVPLYQIALQLMEVHSEKK